MLHVFFPMYSFARLALCAGFEAAAAVGSPAACAEGLRDPAGHAPEMSQGGTKLQEAEAQEERGLIRNSHRQKLMLAARALQIWLGAGQQEQLQCEMDQNSIQHH